MFPLSSQIIKATGVVTTTAWAGAAYNLLLYILASHVLGAAWYVLSIDRYTSCWKSVCRNELAPVGCLPNYLDCDTLNYDEGLQQLSSYGQNLSTSTFIGETSFAILIVIVGLVLFANLIGSMQTYLQSITLRLEEWRIKRRDTEEWMRHCQLPEDLKRRIWCFVQYKWVATRGVDEETILRGLPADLCRDIQRHLCLDLVRQVPFFSQMDDQLLDAICERLVSSLCTEGTYIVREDDPVIEMLFISVCFIGAAWRRQQRRLMTKHLCMRNGEVNSGDGTKVNLGLASRFAANTRRGEVFRRSKLLICPSYRNPKSRTSLLSQMIIS